MNEFEMKLEALTQFALDIDNAPLDVFTQLGLEDLHQLKSYIGTPDPHLPSGYLDHLDRRSIEWANLSTDFRRDFERSVFTAATLISKGGLSFLYEFVFQPPQHEVDAMHWEYACLSAMEYLVQMLGQSDQAVYWMEKILVKLDAEPFRGRIFAVFLDGLNVSTIPSGSELPNRIHAMVMRGMPFQPNLDWMFALKFKDVAPDLAAPIAQSLIHQLNQDGHAARNLEELNYLVQLHQFSPGEEILKKSFARTLEHWLSNEMMADGLYLLVMICNYQDYEAFIAMLMGYAERLERITRKLPPVPGLHPFQMEDLMVLRSHMLLYKLGNEEQYQAAKTYFQSVQNDYPAEEWAELQNWLG